MYITFLLTNPETSETFQTFFVYFSKHEWEFVIQQHTEVFFPIRIEAKKGEEWGLKPQQWTRGEGWEAFFGFVFRHRSKRGAYKRSESQGGRAGWGNNAPMEIQHQRLSARSGVYSADLYVFFMSLTAGRHRALINTINVFWAGCYSVSEQTATVGSSIHGAHSGADYNLAGDVEKVTKCAVYVCLSIRPDTVNKQLCLFCFCLYLFKWKLFASLSY